MTAEFTTSLLSRRIANEPSGAIFTPCRRFRYILWRRWAPGPIAHFCLLNPSIADEATLDPTLRRAKGFSEQWDMGAMLVTNFCPIVATDPKIMLNSRDRFGEINGLHYINDDYIDFAAREAAITVVGWGTNVRHKALSPAVPRLYHQVLKFYNPKALRVSREGHPVHPLYLPYSATLKDWTT